MPKFNINKLARLGEIGTAIVVVVTLIYIAVELDQSNRATHTASWQAVNDMLMTLDTTEAAELGVFIQTAELDPDAVDAEEYWKFSRMAQARLGVIEFSFLGLQTGTLSEYHWGAVSGYLSFTMCKPGYQRVWSEIGEAVYHTDFQVLVNAIIAKCDSEP